MHLKQNKQKFKVRQPQRAKGLNISTRSALEICNISLLLVLCLLVLLFAVSVVGCLLGYSSCLVVWIPLFLDPSDGAFGRFDLAALCGCRTLNFCLFVLLFAVSVVGCLLGYSSCLVVWIPLFLDPSAGAFGRFDLAALCGCRTLNFCLFVLLFAVSVVGCLLGYSSCLVVWIPLFLDPSAGAFGRFDLAALCGCRTLNFCFVCLC